jgi:hypothetical protein
VKYLMSVSVCFVSEGYHSSVVLTFPVILLLSAECIVHMCFTCILDVSCNKLAYCKYVAQIRESARPAFVNNMRHSVTARTNVLNRGARKNERKKEDHSTF